MPKGEEKKRKRRERSRKCPGRRVAARKRKTATSSTRREEGGRGKEEKTIFWFYLLWRPHRSKEEKTPRSPEGIALQVYFKLKGKKIFGKGKKNIQYVSATTEQRPRSAARRNEKGEKRHLREKSKRSDYGDRLGEKEVVATE